MPIRLKKEELASFFQALKERKLARTEPDTSFKVTSTPFTGTALKQRDANIRGAGDKKSSVTARGGESVRASGGSGGASGKGKGKGKGKGSRKKKTLERKLQKAVL